MAVRPRRSRPAVLVVSTLAMGLGAAPTLLTRSLGPALRDALALSGAWLGLLVGLFYGATGLTSFGASRLIDRLGARRCVAGDQAVVAAALTAAAVTSSLPVLAVGSALAGSAYAFANAGTSVAGTAGTPPPRGRPAGGPQKAGAPRGGAGAGRSRRSPTARGPAPRWPRRRRAYPGRRRCWR